MTQIFATDVLFYLSAPTATSGNSAAGTPGSSLGKFISTTQLSTANNNLDNLFTDLTGTQNAAMQVDYQCLFVYNGTSSGNTMLNTVAWIPSNTDVSGGTTHAVGVDPTAASVRASTTAQALTIANATTAPSGVTFIGPSSAGGATVSLGNIPAGSVRAIWFRRTATNSAPVNNDGFTVEIDFDTQG